MERVCLQLLGQATASDADVTAEARECVFNHQFDPPQKLLLTFNRRSQKSNEDAGYLTPDPEQST